MDKTKQIKKQIDHFSNYFDAVEILLDTIPFVFCKDINGIYHGGNLNQARTFGFYNPSEFVGKTIFEILDDQESAKIIDQTDREIMQKGVPSIVEEAISTQSGTKIYLSQKQPIRDSNGVVIGMLGFAMDVTEIKTKQKQAEAQKEQLENEKYQIELDYYKRLSEQQTEFQQIASQVAHDIVSPLSAFSTILSMLKEIPEKHRITLKQAATRIEDITNDLLKNFRPPENVNTNNANETDTSFTYIALCDILSEKRIEYHSLPINFSQQVASDAYFAFIPVNSKSFQRMLSNLVNNAVDALEGKPGKITIKFCITNDTVCVAILDNGKGMSSEVRESILQGAPVTTGKPSGRGIGFTQVRDTVQQSRGTMAIESTEGVGTKVVLTFPKAHTPKWAATELILDSNQTVLILDDDPFIHGAWEAHFAQILTANPEMRLLHFSKGRELLDFLAAQISADSTGDTDKYYLLSDHELIDQELNGLEVISQSKLKNAILVTSHYADPKVLSYANELGVTLLPKRLASKVPIHITSVSPPKQTQQADIVLLDDCQMFADSIIFRLSHRRVKHYLDPRIFLEECAEYAKDTPICIDNHFGVGIDIGGIEVAKQLNELGFSRLFIVSGAYFEPNALPPYVTLVKKLQLEPLDSL